MNHSNFKSLAFYGIAIVSVLLLFNTVSTYGETNLKAPTPIKSRYHIVWAEDLPHCQKSKDLILNIQQSGIYLNASLLKADTNSAIPKNYHTNDYLSGTLRNKKLSLAGKIDRGILCNFTSKPNLNLNSATLQMQLVKPGNLIGKLTINSSDRSFKFTAVPQKSKLCQSVAKKSICRRAKDGLFYPLLSTINH